MDLDRSQGIPVVYLVDDEEVVRDALAWLLRSRRLLSEGFASADAFEAWLATQTAPGRAAWPPAPACLVLDVRMPGTSGLVLFERLAERGLLALLPVIFLTGHGDVPTAVAAVKRGAFDFVEKPFSNNLLVDRVEQALAKSGEALAERARQDGLKRALADLTEREREVMQLVIEGRPNKLIADELDISVRTVEVHRARVFDKMHVKSAVELANLLASLGKKLMAGEFDLIARHFTRPVRRADLGVGDDCALLRVAAGQQLVVSSDMLVEGRHFLSTVAPERLGHKALAVNLSDLAACGAEPLAFTLALAMPRGDEAFAAGFAQGLFALADAQGIELVGGDTTAGPLNICITVMGQVPTGQALLRSGARAGDELWVSGALGDARLALEVFRGAVSLHGEAFDVVRRAMEMPTPRVALGVALRGLATSAIDLSDGLLGDLAHVLQRSNVGAVVNADALPRSAVLAGLPLVLQRECGLAGGDDYELLFTAPASRHADVRAAGTKAGVAVTPIGLIESTAGLRVVDAHGERVPTPWRGFDHFA